jgi:sulfhydrogenase subunit beta (sulfur reductase)
MHFRIETAAVQSLIEALHQRQYNVLGPTLRGGAIVYDTIASVADLPKGWTEEQRPGHYRVRERGDDMLFGFTVGPQSWKKFLFPPVLQLFSAKRSSKQFTVTANSDEKTIEHSKPLAFLGVRSCELHAISIQDKIFSTGGYQDPHYSEIRKRLFIVAVNCSVCAETCFCTSMETGPKAKGGFDLLLTEVIDKKDHFFTVEVGSPAGDKILKTIQHRPAKPDEVSNAQSVVDRTASAMTRTLDTTGIKDLLYSNSEHPEWDKVAERCLSCANCTMVCPTCFCNTVEDTTDLSGSTALRTRTWDSCFTLGFSYLHGGSVRTSTKSRYRQWMTHKLAAWIDQFGTSGCVGCGRCITWCPVGIDITDEARVIRNDTSRERESQHIKEK